MQFGLAATSAGYPSLRAERGVYYSVCVADDASFTYACCVALRALRTKLDAGKRA